MPEEYLALVTAMKALTKAPATTSETEVTLLMAEDEWTTRPDADSYGMIALDFEVDALYGDDVKQAEAYEGSVDLYSRKKDGEGWPALIRRTLTEHCGGCWELNYHGHEVNTGLYHWEWWFQVEG
jgi:hypothetical protein